MRIFFAGSDASERYNEKLILGGAKNRLESYWALQKGKPSNKQFDYYLLDSGGYSARIRGVEIDVAEYARFINNNGIKYAFNLDTNSVPETLKNQKYLEENTDAYIIPIYHLSDYVDSRYRNLIEKYTEAYDFISLGGSAGVSVNAKARKQFLEYSFSYTKDKVRVHGLGMTAKWMLERYPFFSVDSTSWQQMVRFASSQVHSNEMAKVRAKKRHYMDNILPEVKHWVEMERHITRLWERRGVKWKDLK